MATTLLDSVVHGFNKPYTRNFWNHTEGNKKVRRIEFLSNPFLYQDANNINRSSAAAGISNYIQGMYAAGKECAIRGPGASFHADNAATVAQNGLFYTLTNGLDPVNVVVPTASYQPTALTFFNDKWWIFTATKTLISTDNVPSSFTASAASAPSKLYKPIVFANKIVLTVLGSNSTVRSTSNGETFATHNLPATGYINGMATDGTTLVIIMSTGGGIWNVYKTTDLTTWTPMEVRWTATSSNVAGTGTSTANTGFYPLGIIYTGSKFVIMASDASIQTMATGEVSLLRCFVADDSSSNFIMKGSYRLPITMTTGHQGNGSPSGSYMMRFYDAGYGKCSANHCMTVHNGRIFMAVSVCYGTWVDASIYKQHTVMMIESSDVGETWNMVDLPPSMFSQSTADNAMVTSCMYSTPNGVVAYPQPTNGVGTIGYFKPNPNALELVVPYR